MRLVPLGTDKHLVQSSNSSGGHCISVLLGSEDYHVGLQQSSQQYKLVKLELESSDIKCEAIKYPCIINVKSVTDNF